MKLSGSRFLWLYYRLKAMGLQEITHRIYEHLLRRLSKYKDFKCTFNVADGQLPSLINLDQIPRPNKKLLNDWLTTAEETMAGKYHFLGVSWPKGITDSKWHFDPETRKSWPSNRYCFDIPYRHTHDYGDIKYVWEINRLQHLHPIAALASISNNKKLRSYCINELESWIDANPPFQGVNWSSGIEMAIRIISFCIVISFVGKNAFSVSQRQKIRRCLAAHGYWLNRYPSYFSSANNHLVAEAAGLFILGTLIPDIPHAKTYAKKGREILTSEALKQIHPDGVGAEQSPTYTAFTLEWLLLCAIVAENQNKPFPHEVKDRLRRAAKHLRWITDNGNNQPHIGDNDEGKVIFNHSEREDHYTSSVLSALCAFLNCPEFAPPATTHSLRNLILGQSQPSKRHPLGIQTFPKGGYTAIREKIANHDVMLVMDHGPLGYLSIAAHGHADALAIWLHIDKQPIFIDAGTYLYHAGKEWRNYFRGTDAHNTLCINNINQSTISGPFNWSFKAKARLLNCISKEKSWLIEAEHNGYTQRFGVSHTRTLSKKKDGFAIEDKLCGKSTIDYNTPVDIKFLINPECLVYMEETGEIIISTPQKTKLIATFSSKEKVRVSIVQVPYSPSFGSKKSTQAIVVSSNLNKLINSPVSSTFTILNA